MPVCNPSFMMRGFKGASSVPFCFCKAGEVKDTGGRFRSYVLWGVIR
jgi:hypothetical protein